MNRALAVLACVALLAACGGSEPVPPSASFAPPSPPTAAADGPSFSGTYVVSAPNVGGEGESSWSATWLAEPVCAESACDSTLTVSRPGFDSYQVAATLKHGQWRWRPVTALMCPDTGSPYQVSGQGFRMRPSGSERIDGVDTVTALDGEVVAILLASGCPKQVLEYAATAERTGT
jgi:hypothetical protein